MGIKPTIKTTTFNLNVLEARWGDPGTWLDRESQFVFRFN